MRRSTVIQAVAGTAVAGMGVWIFTRQVSVPEMVAEMRRTAWWKIAVAAVLNPATLFLRSIRWRIMLPERPGCSKRSLYPLVVIGFMVNNIFPARIGEAARAALLWKRNRFSVAESVGSLVIERLLDVMVYMTFLAVPVFCMPRLGEAMPYVMAASGVFIFMVLCFAAYALNPVLTARTGKTVLNILPGRIQGFTAKIGKELVSNLDWLFSVRKSLLVILLSFVTLFCQAGMLLVLGFEAKGLGLLTSLYGVAFGAIGAAIPLAPGYVGTLHAMMVHGMSQAGIPADTAGAIAVMYHAIGYVTISLMGIYYFFNLKITLKDIQKAKGDVVAS